LKLIFLLSLDFTIETNTTAVLEVTQDERAECGAFRNTMLRFSFLD